MGSLKELKQHAKRSEIEPDNYVQTTEGIIERLKKWKRCSEVKPSCSEKLLEKYLYVIMLDKWKP